MANKYMKNCSTVLAIKEMQVKTMLKFYLKPVKIAIIKKTTTENVSGRPSHIWWERKLVQSRWRFIKKLKIVLYYDPAISLLGIYP
jgi:hypothetical protein